MPRRVPSASATASSTNPKQAKSKIPKKNARSGLYFNVHMIKRQLGQRDRSMRILKTSGVYLAAVLEYLCAELLDLAGHACHDNNKSRITPRFILLAIHNDSELLALIGRNTIISRGGVLPGINPALLPGAAEKAKAGNKLAREAKAAEAKKGRTKMQVVKQGTQGKVPAQGVPQKVQKGPKVMSKKSAWVPFAGGR